MNKQYVSSVAAKWWADKLRRIEINNFRSKSNDNCSISDVILTTFLSCKYKNDDDSIRAFEKTLESMIVQEFTKRDAVSLKVAGIYPCEILSKAALEANVNLYGLPWNTDMYIMATLVKITSPDGVKVIYTV